VGSKAIEESWVDTEGLQGVMKADCSSHAKSVMYHVLRKVNAWY
jgi:hypothetical protein